MRIVLLSLLFLGSLQGYAQPSAADAQVVKTYERGSWEKWYFKESSLVTTEAGDFNKWHIGMWGMELYIKTVEKDNWTAWEVEYMNSKCYLADGKHFNHWIFEGDGMKVQIKATDKKMTTWSIETENPVQMVMQEDRNTWLLYRLESGTGSASLDVLTVFIPIFSAVIRTEYKLK